MVDFDPHINSLDDNDSVGGSLFQNDSPSPSKKKTIADFKLPAQQSFKSSGLFGDDNDDTEDESGLFGDREDNSKNSLQASKERSKANVSSLFNDDSDDDVDDEADIDDDIEVFEEDIPAYHSAADEVETVRDETQKIIESRVDPIEWKTELERVGPRLRISNAVGGKEWRSHIDQTKKHSSLIENELPSTEATLRTINNQLETAVDRMRTKEKYVNSQYSSLVQEYQDIRSDMKSIEDTYQSSNSKVTSLQNDLAAVAEQLSDIKGTMDSRGSSMTDTSPLVKIKAALQDIKVEIGHFELRIGVVAHTLLSAQASSVGQENSGVIIDGDDDDDDDDYEP